MDTSLNKYISESGFCSRREADKYIEQLRVTINGVEALKGNRVKEGDIVLVDGEPIRKKKETVYLALNKPKGVTCTTDLKDKTNIIDYVNFKTRIFPIGRLDKRSEGLIFLTNDGDIVNKILRAGNRHEKEYIVTVDRPISPDFIQKMRGGVRILGTVTQKCFVKQEGSNRFRIILTQGLNRQIRRMCEVLGYNVETLKRTRIMSMTLGGLPPGKWRYFTAAEIGTINEMLKNSSKTAEGSEGMDE
ncbi:MAG: 23S rRNA pseudouridine(2604) synthase RluF [Ferruginibacter sp.]|nr:23S rRNA pseudouridine(2604) synthase RluF [Chitinophagaceae bacterium]MBP6285445.1 23S rRNA pseudouridine(2604) synthase RluF [Ferruginibacter sp.]MBU9935071.1 23S rRNA pseudouridine(2604) synthase RluF [Ferruginibacter sp.]HQY10876.1 23S rRNA pseudouridine(2604) synthase RluF [Ferruginibacter sp.]